MTMGKNVRAPSLMSKTDYVMKTWGKNPTYDVVHYVHFVCADGRTLRQAETQLKAMKTADRYLFTDSTGNKFTGKMVANCLVHEQSEARLTFFQLATAVEQLAAELSVAVEQAVELPPTAPEPEMLNIEVTLSDAIADVAEAPAGETAAERKNRRRREARAAARAAQSDNGAQATA
jgi:hypothetical protein